MGALGGPCFHSGGLGFRKENTVLLKQFNEFLPAQAKRHPRGDGRPLDGRPAPGMRGIPAPERRSRLVGASATAACRSSRSGQQADRLRNRALARFEAQIGMKVRFSNMDFAR